MKQNIILCSVFLLIAISMTTNVSGRTIRIPEDCLTIQTAINHAQDGDTVLVSEGTYRGFKNKNLDFLGKAIVVMSESGPDVTVIDCENSGRGFIFHSFEDSLSLLIGFTVKGGNVTSDGGGILCGAMCSPYIIDCIILENKTSGIIGQGGGLYIDENASPTIRNCTFKKNSTINEGGAIYINSGASPLLIDCLISENSSACDGGGVFLSGASTSFSNCIISLNSASWDGGGLFSNKKTNLKLSKCNIMNNTSFSCGGGGYLSNTTLDAD
jgi:hypothetical protein